jgi:peptidoglycan/LPS O-acetylase OafA/YrhL
MEKLSSPQKRYHDLDALRAFAMLLGILLHGALSFFPVSIWPAQDLHQPVIDVPTTLTAPLEQAGIEAPTTYSPYEFMVHAIHGFRLPLFFMVSGFFTAMLWRNRGLKQLAMHRAKRILLPLVIFVPIIWILIIPVGIYGGAKMEEVRKLRAQSTKVDKQEAKPLAINEPQAPDDIGKAAGSGDLKAIERHIMVGTDLNQRGTDQSTPLMSAITFGRVEVAKTLIEAGAALDLKNKDGSTALLMASFFAHPEIVEALLDAGADPNIRNNDGTTALDVVKTPWEEIKFIYDIVGGILGPAGLKMDYERIQETRPKTAVILKEKGAKQGGGGGDLAGLVMLIFFAPIFHHLWFLYYLVWLMAGFILITWLLGKMKLKPLPDWLVTSPLCWLWLLPVTFLAQLLMKDSFGPDTATGFLPWPPILIYYAVFFFFGTLCFGRNSFEAKTGKLWPISFILAVPLLLAGLCLVRNQDNVALLAACSVAYAWLMIFGFIGFFRAFFSGENPRIRYISDSSYWLYIMHLPVIMFVQALISTWDMPSILKFLIACALTTLPLLLIYELVVRYTFVGTLLNGKRTRTSRMPTIVQPPIV